MEIKMENEKNKKKRHRSENWLEEDKNLLMDLVRERVSIIENKNTDTNTNSKKLAAWADLLTSFNSMCKGGTRSLAQLKCQWSIIKMTKKKMKSEERKKLFLTGGGPPPPTNPENPNDIYAWLPNEFKTDLDEFDCDTINQIKAKMQKKEKNDANANDINNTIDVENIVGKPLEINFNVDEMNTEINVGNVVGKPIEITFNVDEMNKKEMNTTHGHGIILNIPDEIPDIATKSQVIAQKPLQEIQNTPKVVSTGSPIIKKPSSWKKSKKMENLNKVSAAETIAAIETECRQQLHAVQMANEETKAQNLALKQSILKVKLELKLEKMVACKVGFTGEDFT